MKFLVSKLLIGHLVDGWLPARYNSNLGNNNWSVIFHFGNQFIAISEDGYISTSANGNVWNDAEYNVNLHLGTDWKDVCTALNYCVAIDSVGHISTANDGLNWSTPTQPKNLFGNYRWEAIGYDYSRSRYVALGVLGHISYSDDLTNWSKPVQDTNLRERIWESLFWTGSYLVALSRVGCISQYVNPGKWEVSRQIANLGNNSWKCFGYDNKGDVLALSSSGYTSKSTYNTYDTTWTEAEFNSNLGNHDWVSFARGNNKLVALSSTGYISTKRI